MNTAIPDKPEDWAFLSAISAYHVAEPGRRYPPILIATSRRDDRVHPGHARKMAAKLQAMRYEAYFYEPPPAATATAGTTRKGRPSPRSGSISSGTGWAAARAGGDGRRKERFDLTSGSHDLDCVAREFGGGRKLPGKRRTHACPFTDQIRFSSRCRRLLSQPGASGTPCTVQPPSTTMVWAGHIGGFVAGEPAHRVRDFL